MDFCRTLAFMKELNSITIEGEVWKSLNQIYPQIHDSWVVSNFGRVFRLSYNDGKRIHHLNEVSLRKIENPNSDYLYFSAGIGNNRTKFSLPLVVSKLFDETFSEVDTSTPHYYFKDGNSTNNHIDNIGVFYPLINYIDLVWDFYKTLSSKVPNKKFGFLSDNELRDLSSEIISNSFEEWKYKHSLPYYNMKPTGAAVIKLISDTMKKHKLKGGIESWLKHHGKNSIDSQNGERIKYISNSGSVHQSRVECFVRNLYFKSGLVDENFVSKSLSQLIGIHLVSYDPVPDEFFIHPKTGQLVVSETFGVSKDKESKDDRENTYLKKSNLKYQLYSEMVFVDLWVKGLTLPQVLDLFNSKLIEKDIISEPLPFSEDLMPQVEKYHIEDVLKSLYNEIGVFEVGELKKKNQYVHKKLVQYCLDLGIMPCQFLWERIYPEIKLPIGEGGFPSVKGYKRNLELISKITDLVQGGFVKNVSDLKKYDKEGESLTDKLFRMTRSIGTTSSKWFKQNFPNLIKTKPSREYQLDELYEKLSGFKNRWSAQQSYPGLYKHAYNLGIIDEIYPKKKTPLSGGVFY